MKIGSRKRSRIAVMGLGALAAGALALPLASPAFASQREAVTIETEKPFGPTPGTFSVSGAFSDSGTFTNTIVFSGIGAPTFGILHVTSQFEGSEGTFTVRANIRFSLTEEPGVVADAGNWVVLDGTGAYEGLHGTGEITGTGDENQNLITRTYAGTVHLE